MCENIKNHVKDLIIIVEQATDFFDGNNTEMNRAAKEYLKKKYNLYSTDYYGFHKALKALEQDFNQIGG